jgi:predicted dehydrogenase
MKLQFGMVGGGGGFIGAVHLHGALLDNSARLVAGCFSRDGLINRETGVSWGADESRIYKNYEIMAEAEGARNDKIDFVIITTPNNSHYPIAKAFMAQGIHVVCDKPLALNLEEALELEAMAAECNLLFCVTYTYAAYAMIRQARELIDAGELGELRFISAEYPQEWLAVALNNDSRELWRLDPLQAGASLCTGDIGTHLHMLIASATGLELKSVLARFDSFLNRPLETNVTAMLKYPKDISGTIWASQIAIGHENDVRLRVYGCKGSLEWFHGTPELLKVTCINRPVRYYSANRDYNYDASNTLCRLPAGHPEGFYGAFANIYRAFGEHLRAVKNNLTYDGDLRYNTVSDGVKGMRFIEACVKSNAHNNIWVDL